MLEELRKELQKTAMPLTGAQGFGASGALGPDFKKFLNYFTRPGAVKGSLGAGFKTFAGAHPLATMLGGLVAAPVALRMLRGLTGGGGYGNTLLG